MQNFTATARNTSNDTVALDTPLEFDIPIDNASSSKSRVTPVTVVKDMGFRDFYLQMSTTGTNCSG